LLERLDEFMARANAAYYATQNPFRDFTTAPEITQMFGELLGAWAATVWQQMGAPPHVVLAEAGPGRGTLMQDARRATAQVAPAFHVAARVHFIENSPRLRAAQRKTVPDATWHDDCSTLPPGPLILLANEFLDALPIRQFIRIGGAWQERYVRDGTFLVCPAGAPMPRTAAPDGTVQEQGDAARAWIAALAARLAAQGGIALILDYGPARSAPGDSLQALRDGRPADPLADPGTADLTAHVDFQAVSEAAQAAGAASWGPLPQGDFLASLGLRQRTASLVASNPARADALRDAADRLAAPSRMGHLFKALAIAHTGVPPPPGFSA
jgi:SAM-dependent MidA family methyltransferase